MAWRRYWADPAHTVHLGTDGYLLDPETDLGALMNRGVLAMKDVSGIPCLLLLGEPGIGKSHSLEELHQAAAATGTETLLKDLGAYSSDTALVDGVFHDPKFVEWVHGTHRLVVFLDAFDECRLNVVTAAKAIAQNLDRLPIERLTVRVACRTAERPSLLEASLQRHWKDGFRALELLPLTRKDIETAASAVRVDPAAFLAELSARQLQPFASRPLTLRFLLKEFRRGGGLPASAAELYARGCLELCSEANESRIETKATGSLTAPDRLRVAELLAAIGVLSKKSRFPLPPLARARDHDDALDLEALADQVQRSSIGKLSTSERELVDVLGTGLFTARGNGFVGWGHATYEAFLAAKFLVNHLDQEQIQNLTLRTDASGRRRAIPQIQDLVAWIAALDERFRATVLSDDPETLLKTTIIPLTDPEKKEIVETLVRMVEAKQLFDEDLDRPFRYAQLNHPGLSQQVRDVLTSPSASVRGKRVALELADECRLGDLSAFLADVALDRRQPTDARERAVSVLSSVGDNEARARLRPLLESDAEHDPDDQLRGNVLRTLWKAGLLGPEVWRYCTEPRRKHHVGAYVLFLVSELPAALAERAQVLAAVEWAQGIQDSDRDLEYGFRELLHKVLAAAWALADDVEVLGSLVEVVASRVIRHDAPLGDDVTASENPGRQVVLMKGVVASGIGRKLTAGHLFAGRHSLMDGVKCEALIGLAAGSSGPESALWARLARLTFSGNSSDVDAVLAAVGRCEALRGEFDGLITPVELGSKRAVEMRLEYEECQRLTQSAVADEEGSSEPEPFDEVLRQHLDGFDAGDLNQWWRLNAAMASWGEHGRAAEREADLEKLPVWATIPASERVRIVTAAARYVQQMRVPDSEALNGKQFHRPAAAGVRALVMLFNRAHSELDALPRACWDAWIPSLMAYGAPTLDRSDVDENLLQRAFLASPARAAAISIAVLEDQDKRSRHAFGAQRLVASGDQALASALATWAVEASLTPESRLSVLREALPRVPRVDRQLAYIADVANPSEHRIAVASAVLVTHAREVWPILWPLFVADREFARKVLGEVADFGEQKFATMLVKQLDGRAIVDLHRLVVELVPPKDDPRPDEGGWVGPIERLRWLRSGLLTALQNKGSDDAVDALRELARSSDEAWHHWLALNADRARIQAGWGGASAPELLRMCADKARRVVETDAQLLEVLVESVARLQAILKGETPAAEDLWNESKPKSENDLSNYVKRHLARDLVDRRVVVNREVEIRPGSETDIRVQAVSAGHVGQPISVTVEVKGCWNKGLKTAMKDQLVDKYMRPAGERAGMYLVGWYRCARWKNDYRQRNTPKWTTSEASEFFETQARELRADGVTIAPVVLDCVVA